MKVSDILRVKGNTLYTATPDEPLAQATAVMAERDIGSLVIMEHGELVGMLTFREVIQAVVENGGAIGNRLVRSAMDDAPLTCTPETDLDEVEDLYLYRRLGGLEAARSGRSAEDELMDTFSEAEVKQAIEDLPENFRMAVLLADVEGFSYKEIAEILDIPIGTVMSRLHRGRKALQKALYEYAVTHGLADRPEGDDIENEPQPVPSASGTDH